jgi:ribosomal protein S27E
MLRLYAARIEDLGRGDFVKVDCAACHHIALLTPEALLRIGLSPAAKVLDLKQRLRCRQCGRKGRAVISVKWPG